MEAKTGKFNRASPACHFILSPIAVAATFGWPDAAAQFCGGPNQSLPLKYLRDCRPDRAVVHLNFSKRKRSTTVTFRVQYRQTKSRLRRSRSDILVFFR